MKTLLLGAQIVIAVVLIAAILIQSRGVGFGRVWGASGSSFSRRGLEKLIFKATFVLCALFVIIAILQFVV